MGGAAMPGVNSHYDAGRRRLGTRRPIRFVFGDIEVAIAAEAAGLAGAARSAVVMAVGLPAPPGRQPELGAALHRLAEIYERDDRPLALICCRRALELRDTPAGRSRLRRLEAKEETAARDVGR